jgi:PEP-CTERM motif
LPSEFRRTERRRQCPEFPFFGGYSKEKKMLRNFLAIFTVVALSLGVASAETLTFITATVDDSFTAYISTSDSTLGTEFDIGNTMTLNAGLDYFIHVVVTNDCCAAGWGGQFTLSGGSDRFANETATEQTASTPSDWQASDGVAPGTLWTDAPLSYTAILESDTPFPPGTGLLWSPGPNASGGTFPGDPGEWNGQCENCQVDFSTEIFPAAPVPEPSNFALLGTGLLGFAGLVRRKIGR